MHQTLLAKACFTGDPRDLHEALLAYPIGADTAAARALWKKLVIASGDTIAPSFRGLLDIVR